MDSGSTALLISLAVAVFVFALIREFITWYFKLNEIVILLRTMDKRMENISHIAQATEEMARNIHTLKTIEHNRYQAEQQAMEVIRRDAIRQAPPVAKSGG